MFYLGVVVNVVSWPIITVLDLKLVPFDLSFTFYMEQFVSRELMEVSGR